MEPETVLEDVSPGGNVQAIVEQDDRVAHFYLWAGPDSEFGTKSCWVRNLKPGSPDRNQCVRDMRAGIPPILASDLCSHPNGAAPLDASRLRIVWFEEGDGAALLEDDTILTVIPGWSGQDGFSGFSRDCTGESPICWPLEPALETMTEKVAASQDYWRMWDEGDGPWPDYQQAMLAAYSALGAYSNYYGIDGGEWPSRAMLRIPVGEKVVLVTLGLALRAQPAVDGYHEDPAPHRRIELGICLAPPYTSDTHVTAMARYISGQATLPWDNFTWLGDGHTIPCDSVPNGESTGFNAVVLTSKPAGAPALDLPPFRGDPIRLLWLIPITQSEREFAQIETSVTLLERIERAGPSWAFTKRPPAV